MSNSGHSQIEVDASRGDPDRRVPRRVYRRGDEPDPRFSLANERTFLAWIRTSLALVAVAVALDTVELDLPPATRTAASLLLVLLGIMCAGHAWFGWVRTETELREGRPLAGPSFGRWISVGVAVSALALAIGLLS